MTHPRSVMRANIRAALDASAALAGVKVYRSWAHAMGRDDVPAIGVFTPRERSQLATGSQVDRTTDIAVMYRTEGGDDLDDHLDAISAVIEPLVLGVLANGHDLYGLDTTDIEINGTGEALTGNLTLTFSAVRYAPEGQPGPL